ncbi:MAG: DUF6261 family protein [Dysgonamonadaceae bacterium]|nr:DUF6261 family protein [Dysgonamonadaceae bacterium]MDD4729796.1 DUF6261 family protein [Dysgonamonadaceae bacterium]
MKKISISFLSRLRNQEFPAAYGMICSILEGEEISVEYVSQSLASVMAQNEKLVFLRNMVLQHPLTGTIKHQTDLRNDYFSSLKGRVTSALKSPVETEREAAEVLNLWLHGYRQYLSTARIHEQTVLIEQMLEEYQSKLFIQEAVTKCGVQIILDSIAAITTEIKDAYVTRSKERTAAKRKAMMLRRVAYNYLKTLLNSIEMVISLGDADSAVYLNYLEEIDDMMEVFRAKYESRTTRRKNAAQKAEENQPEDHENDDQDGDAMPTDSQPETAGTSRKFNVMTLDGMDSHNGLTNESLNGNDVMSNSVTNGEAIDGKKNEPSTGNGAFVNGDVHNPEKGIAMYNGTNGIDQSLK